MSDFFEPPPPPSEPEPERAHPPWWGRPRGTLPGVVAVEMMLAKTDRVAVCVNRLAVYPTGFEFDIATFAAPGEDPELDPMMFGHHRHRALHQGGREMPDEFLRFGVQFADGSKATNLGGFHHDDDPPEGPVMHPAGGTGGGGEWRQTQWVWPLPPPGPVTFVCEWPALGISLTHEEIDAQVILEAAGRARVVFEDVGSSGGPRPSATSMLIGPTVHQVGRPPHDPGAG